MLFSVATLTKGRPGRPWCRLLEVRRRSNGPMGRKNRSVERLWPKQLPTVRWLRGGGVAEHAVRPVRPPGPPAGGKDP